MRILVSAYACEPGRGSEPGAGWNWARELAAHHDVWILTRANNREPIEAELRLHPEPRMHFIFVDLPDWIRRWKRGQRGIHAYAYAWQLAARRAARAAHTQYRFELVHHLTFASVVTPALTALPGVPFVWGPVGGGVRVPWRLVFDAGPQALSYEALRSTRRITARYLDPFLRWTWRRADLILAQNRETLSWLPAAHQRKARIAPNAGVDDEEIRDTPRDDRDGFVVVAAGRLIHLKAFSLAVRAVAKVRDLPVRLLVAGDGPEGIRLERLARRLGIQDRVTLLGLLPRDALLELLASADALLFPSLHDESPLVVVEAMSQGALPIVLDIGGSATLVGTVGYRVSARGRSRREVVGELAIALRDACERDDLPQVRATVIARARAFAWSTKPANIQSLVSTTATARSAVRS
jgi:glycosyltransferase involved in cell wall biosynthesis